MFLSLLTFVIFVCFVSLSKLLLTGWIADRDSQNTGYRHVFLCTAIIQFIGGVTLYIPLLWLADDFESSSSSCSDISGSDE